jgi:hypothetical protein
MASAFTSALAPGLSSFEAGPDRFMAGEIEHPTEEKLH